MFARVIILGVNKKRANGENLIDKNIFHLELRNRFNALYCEDQELDI